MKQVCYLIICLLSLINNPFYAGEYEDVLQEAELMIESTYRTELSRTSATKKLSLIINDDKLTEKEKIEKITIEFLQPKNTEINEQNAYKLVYVPPLTWTVHSIAIAYDTENTQQLLFDGKMLDTLEASSSNKNTSTKTISDAIMASAGMSLNASANLNASFNPAFLL